MISEKISPSLEEASKETPNKLDQVYQKLAFYPDDLEKTYQEREKQLNNKEKDEERLAYFETLMSHENYLKEKISQIEKDIGGFKAAGEEERYQYRMMPWQAEKFMSTYKKEYGVSSMDELLTEGTIRDIMKYGSLKLPEKVIYRAKNHYGSPFFSKREIGLYNTSLGKLNKKHIEIANTKLIDLRDQLKNIQDKLKEFEMK